MYYTYRDTQPYISNSKFNYSRGGDKREEENELNIHKYKITGVIYHIDVDKMPNK